MFNLILRTKLLPRMCESIPASFKEHVVFGTSAPVFKIKLNNFSDDVPDNSA